MDHDLARLLYLAIDLMDSGRARDARELLASCLRDAGAVVCEPLVFIDVNVSTRELGIAH